MAIRGRLRGVGDAVGQAAASGRAAAGQAATAGRDAADRSLASGRAAVSRAAAAGGAQAAAGGDWVLDAIDRIPVPQAPAVEPWVMSLGALISSHPMVPTAAARPLKLLDRLGALRLGPDSVGFDTDDISWDKVTNIRMYGGYRSLTKELINTQFDIIRAALVGLPGRDWVLERVAEALTTLLFNHLASAEDSGTMQDVLIPGEIDYRGRFGRNKTCTASLYPTAFLLTSPAMVKSLLVTAQAKGVTVTRPQSGELDVVQWAELEEVWARTAGVAPEPSSND